MAASAQAERSIMARHQRQPAVLTGAAPRRDRWMCARTEDDDYLGDQHDRRITLSHEALELLADPEANLLVQGPHPSRPRHKVFHWFEMCDAVQDEHYLIDDVPVSNFVLPLYFTSSDERGGRNDFLGTAA